MDVIGGIAVVVLIGVIIIAIHLKANARRAARPNAWPMPATVRETGLLPVETDDEPFFGEVNITLPDIFKFEVGAYLIDGISRNHIAGRVDYRQGRYIWVEYYLTDTSWLGADKDEGDRLINWERVIPSDLAPSGRKPIIFKGVTYEYVERGEATYSTNGQVGDLAGNGIAEYVDYATDDGQYFLSFERYDGADDWEVAIGEQVTITTLEYYPPGKPSSVTDVR